MATAPSPDAPPLRRVGTAARAADPTGFWSLRGEAIARAQAASGTRWTDYNLHDPGVTIIEAVAYALTSLVYAVDFPVADHLARADGRIDWHRAGLMLPEAIFPCRATTAADLRRIVLDGDASLRDVRAVPLHGDAASGLHSLRLLPAAGATGDTARARRVYAGQRLLGEDLDDAIAAIGTTLWVLTVDIEVRGARDPVEVKADVFDACDRLVAPAPAIADPRELCRAGQPLDAILDGPPMRYGHIDAGDLSPSATDGDAGDRLALGDLRRAILAVDDVSAVTDLRLDRDDADGPVAADATLTWRGADAVPVLAVPLPHYDPMLQGWLVDRVRLERRGLAIATDAGEVTRRLAVRRRQRAGGWSRRAIDQIVVPPVGTPRAVAPWRSIAHLFPPLYRLDPALPHAERNDQLHGYLGLFDGFLADAQGQIDDLRHRFSIARADASLTASDGLVRTSHADAIGRHAVFDYLLAMYGEAVDTQLPAQFLDYLDPSEQDAAMLTLKAAFLADIVAVGRDRVGGVDYTRPLLDPGAPDATPGFARRLALLVGFADPRTRRLTAGLAGEDPARGAAARPIRGATVALPGLTGHRAVAVPADATLTTATVALADLLAHGVDRAAYRWHATDRTLWLTSAPATGWPIATGTDERSANHVATWLRDQLRHLTDACEGVHVVEHILLRPRLRPADPGFAPLRVTLVFPGWTRRTAHAGFRAFAEETARAQAPAHVALRCRWLDIADLVAFETDYAAWAALLQQSPGGSEAAALDAAAAAVENWVRPAWTAP